MTTSSEKKRVGIIAISHESNTFIDAPTTLEDFQKSLFVTGEEVRTRYGAAHHEVSGFFQTLAEAGIEAVPIIFAQTAPWGVVSDEALDTIWTCTLEGLRSAGRLDGVLAAPHGAGVNASRPDMDGWWLGQLRRFIGPDLPLIATMDPHVNLSPAMVEACDALIAYRQNPHLDQRERGAEAAKLMIRTLQDGIRPVMAASFPPVTINIERQLTSAEPMLSVIREVDSVRALPGILTASAAFGFPYADVSDMGSAFVVVSDGNPALARQQAERLGTWLMENRERFRGEMITPDEALDMAGSAPKPVGLLDMGDNLGGGAPGDSTVLARLCQQRKIRNVFLPIPDAESVAAAQEAGIGARIRLKVGGKLSMTPEPPLEVNATVVSLHDGIYHEAKARHGGKTGGNMGPTAIIRTDDGFTIMLTSRRAGPNNSAEPLRACGLKAEDFDILIIRGVHAPIGAYAELCPTLIRVNTPGVTSADMETLEYRNRRKPLFPFEDPSGAS